MLYSGIDLHKRSLVIHTLDTDGTTTREAELNSDSERPHDAFRVGHVERLVVVVEVDHRA